MSEQPTGYILDRIKRRPNDAPLHVEYLIDDCAAEITRLRSELEQAKDYVSKALASFEADPADNRFLKGFQAALEVVRDEAFSSPVASTDGQRT